MKQSANTGCEIDKLETGNDASDAALLERFVARRDHAAFAAIVLRYGPLVLNVCRRVLRHAQDAEDAFQASFLVLAQKAGSIRRQESVGSWLYGVAFRIARKARTVRDRKKMRDTELSHVPERGAREQIWDGLMPIIDEEVNRLPAKYRRPFVLCHLTGRTNREAARQLGCPVGTVLSRLSRARARLRARLTQRGVSLSVGTLVAVMAERANAATVPIGLVDATTRAALSYTTAAAGGVVTTAPVTLARGYLSMIFWSKIAMTAGCLLVVVIGASAGPSAIRWAAKEHQSAALNSQRRSDQARMQGTWRLVLTQFGGQPLPAANSQWVFDGDQCTTYQNGVRLIGKTCTLEPTQAPKAIDVVTEQGLKLWGIYAIDDDTLTFCLTMVEGQRPPKFVTSADTDYLLIVLKRE